MSQIFSKFVRRLWFLVPLRRAAAEAINSSIFEKYNTSIYLCLQIKACMQYIAVWCFLSCNTLQALCCCHGFSQVSHGNPHGNRFQDVPWCAVCRVLFLTGFRLDACCHCLWKAASKVFIWCSSGVVLEISSVSECPWYPDVDSIRFNHFVEPCGSRRSRNMSKRGDWFWDVLFDISKIVDRFCDMFTSLNILKSLTAFQHFTTFQDSSSEVLLRLLGHPVSSRFNIFDGSNSVSSVQQRKKNQWRNVPLSM